MCEDKTEDEVDVRRDVLLSQEEKERNDADDCEGQDVQLAGIRLVDRYVYLGGVICRVDVLTRTRGAGES